MCLLILEKIGRSEVTEEEGVIHGLRHLGRSVSQPRSVLEPSLACVGNSDLLKQNRLLKMQLMDMRTTQKRIMRPIGKGR